jgi:ATP-dependent protease ClpP protease subunit
MKKFIAGLLLMTSAATFAAPFFPLPLPVPLPATTTSAEIDTIDKPYKIYRGTFKTDVYMDTEVKSPADYLPLIRLLREANALDNIHIYINGYGGNVDTGLQLIQAVNESSANITYHVDGMAMSMYALMLCTDRKVIYSPSSTIMFHSGNSNMSGKISDQRAFYTALDEHIRKFMHKNCKCLTHNEIDKIQNGIDLYFTGEELQNRLNNSEFKQ